MHRQIKERETDLEKRMSSDNLQKSLKGLSARLYDFFGEAVGKNLAGQRGNGDA